MAIKVGKILGRVAKAAAANPVVTVAIVAGVAPGLAAKLARFAPLVGAVAESAGSDKGADPRPQADHLTT